jgi:hypothetical protein
MILTQWDLSPYVHRMVKTRQEILKGRYSHDVSPFVSVGLDKPGALVMSPGGAWGHPGTMYVSNAGGKVIHRIDKEGRITTFAAGFTNVYALHFESYGPAFGVDATLKFSDSAATEGAVWYANPRRVNAFPELTGCNPCRVGETFSIWLTVENRGPIAVDVEIKSGFWLPDGTPVNVPPLADPHMVVTLQPGFMFGDELLSFKIPKLPYGTYCYAVGLGGPKLPTSSLGGAGAICFDIIP